MSDGVITKMGREKLCKAHAGDIVLPKITQIVLGSGGADESGNVIAATGEETGLRQELVRKDIDGHMFDDPYSCTYTITLEKGEYGNMYISEQGLVDAEGDLIMYKTFMPKGKDEDIAFKFDITEKF